MNHGETCLNEPSQTPDHSDLILVDSIYSSAVDPRRFERLIDNWDARISVAGYTPETLGRLNGSDIIDHFSKALEAASRIHDAGERSLAEVAVDRIDTAALVVNASGRILACNMPAKRTFTEARPGGGLAELPFSRDGIEQFLSSIENVTGANDGRHEILRLRPETSRRPIYAFVRPLRDGPQLHALIVTTEHVWQPEVEKALQRAFTFTAAEVNVLRMIMSGVSVAEISAALARSEATIRSQIHGMLSKTGTRSQAELMSLMLAFQDSTDEDTLADRTVRKPDNGTANTYETLVLPDGRRLDYLRLGHAAGRSILWLHGNLAQCRLTRSAEDWLRANRLTVIVPIRAGYGYSSPLPPGQGAIATALSDIAHLRRYLGIGGCPLVGIGNDFLLACHLALTDPQAVTHLHGIGAAFPIHSQEDYARLNKWARFFRANARHAPRILSFLGRATYTMVRRMGLETYVETVMRGTPDFTAFGEPEIRAAVLAGMEIMWGDGVRSHDAFAADTIATHRDPWPDIGTISCPVTLYHGRLDQNVSCLSAEDHARRHGWKIVTFDNAGSFVHHTYWREILENIASGLVETAPSSIK